MDDGGERRGSDVMPEAKNRAEDDEDDDAVELPSSYLGS